MRYNEDIPRHSPSGRVSLTLSIDIRAASKRDDTKPLYRPDSGPAGHLQHSIPSTSSSNPSHVSLMNITSTAPRNLTACLPLKTGEGGRCSQENTRRCPYSCSEGQDTDLIVSVGSGAALTGNKPQAIPHTSTVRAKLLDVLRPSSFIHSDPYACSARMTYASWQVNTKIPWSYNNAA
jgi:hypothetical protein